jgi:L-fuconolactonase
MARIDAHLHVFAKVSEEFPRETTEVCPADREESVEKLMDSMDEHNIDQAVLVQIGGAEHKHHAYLQHCLKAYEGKFQGIGLIPGNCESPGEHMDRLADGGGIIGFRLGALGGSADPLSPMEVSTFGTYPVWKRAAEKDYVLWLYPRAVDAPACAFLIDAFPQVRVVFNHLMVCPGEGRFTWDEFGRPKIDTPMPPITRHSLLNLFQYENVHVLLSGQYAFSKEEYPYSDLASWHQSLRSKFGSNRLMWATDFPWILEEPGYGNLVKVIDEMIPDLTEKEHADIMGDTAKHVLRFK